MTIDAIGYKNSVTVKQVERASDDGKKKPRQQAAHSKPESDEEKKRLGVNVDERC